MPTATAVTGALRQTIATVAVPKHEFVGIPGNLFHPYCKFPGCGMHTTDSIHNSVEDFEARVWRTHLSYEQQEAAARARGHQVDFSDLDADERRSINSEITPIQDWAVYDRLTGVRIAYSDSEDDARDVAARWNAGKMSEKPRNKVDSTRRLRRLLKPGDTVSGLVRSVSRSGMFRRISFFVARDGEIIDITWDVARAFGDPVKQRGEYVQNRGLAVSGCGMDMVFAQVYNLGAVLWPDGFGARRGIAPNGKEMSTDVGRGFSAVKKGPISRERVAELASRGWKFRGRNGDASGWETDGGYALKKESL